MRDNIETELKLRIAPARVRSAIEVLTRISGTEPRINQLDAQYYDTKTAKLWRLGYAFRVRREEDAFVQTLKCQNGVDPLSRSEWSHRASAISPDILSAAMTRRVRGLIGTSALVPKFRVQVSRSIFTIRGADRASIEVAVDVGQIITPDGARERICELEMELKSGAPWAIYRAALRLCERIDCALEPQSKSARGHGLLRDTPKVARLDPPAFKPSTLLDEALRQAARRYFAQFIANVPLMMKGDATAVHMMRVAVRRLRSAIAAAKPFLAPAAAEKANVQLRSIQQSLGALRDFDVLSAGLATHDSGKSGANKGRRDLAEWVDRRRRTAMSNAERAVGSKEQTLAWLRSMEWLESLDRAGRRAARSATPLRRAVPVMLDRLFKRVRKRGRNVAGQNPTELHRLRIACKKLRYGLELFRSLYAAKDVAAMLRPLKALQEDLGTLNDTHVARPVLGAGKASDKALQYARLRLSRMERQAAAATTNAARRMERLKRSDKFW